MPARFFPIAVLAALTLAARDAVAQSAGVITPPPARRAAPESPAVVARRDSAARMRLDSLSIRQRLGIQAWVDSASAALAAGSPATTVPLTPPPPPRTPPPVRTDTLRTRRVPAAR